MKRSKIKLFCIYAANSLLGLAILLPIAFALVSSFRSLDDIYRYMSPVSWATFFPTDVTFEAYVSLFAERGFGRIFFNTFYVSFVKVIFGVAVASMAAFAFVNFEFIGKKLLFGLVMLSFMIPFEVIAIPLYSLVDRLGWIDTYTGIIVPGIVNGMVIFLYRQFFLDMPKSLAESARIDGAGWLTIYAKIIMPLCKPVTVSAALMLFISMWESFMWPLIATRSKEYKVIQVALSDFVTEFATYWNEMYAAAMISIIIPVLVLLPLQRYFVQGITSSGSKE